MTTLQRCHKYLNQHHIKYSHSIHAPAYSALEIANAERMPAHNLAKVVVYCGDNGFGMLVLPADTMADLPEVRRLLGLEAIRLADEIELLGLFPDCELGAMPPFGKLYELPVLLDAGLAEAEFMAFSAGTHKDVIHLSLRDFRQLTNPLVAAFALSLKASARA